MNARHLMTQCVLICALAFTLSSCDDEGEDLNANLPKTGVESIEEAYASAAFAAVAHSLWDGQSTNLTFIADPLSMSFTPNGCLSASVPQIGNTLELKFGGCESVFGLKDVSGELTLSSASDGNLSFIFKELKTNGASLNGSMTSNLQNELGAENLSLSYSLNRTSGRLLDLDFVNGTIEAIFSMETECLSLDGSLNGSSGEVSNSFEVKNYQRCEGGCPTTSSEMTFYDQDHTEFSIHFEGASEASVQQDGTEKERVSLSCAP